MSQSFHTVHVRVNDAATGLPTPVRIRFSNPAGEYFAPLGRLMEFATGPGEDVGGNLELDKKKYAYIDGHCEIRLPHGPLRVEIRKGLEYAPLSQDILLGRGQLALRLQIDRWTDMRRERWYAGETRATDISPHGALLEGAAEDLAVVNLLIEETTVSAYDYANDTINDEMPAIPNILAFSGQKPALEHLGTMVVVNTLNRIYPLGRVGLLNCHRPVYPLWAQMPENPLGVAVADLCDQCHRKGGLVIWPDDTLGRHSDLCDFEILADLILDKIDAFEVDWFGWRKGEGKRLTEWYQLLNCGMQLPLVGGSGKFSNAIPLGLPRTYARLLSDEDFTYRNWIEAVRAGRTFVTDGPLLVLTVNGHDPGTILDLPPEGAAVHVRAEVQGADADDRLEVVLNGQVIASTKVNPPPLALIDTDVRIAAGSWLTARCWRNLDNEGHDGYIGAHTSPVYLLAGGKRGPLDADALARHAGYLDKLMQAVQAVHFEDAKQRDHLLGIFASARNALLERAGHDFQRGGERGASAPC